MMLLERIIVEYYNDKRYGRIGKINISVRKWEKKIM